MRTEGWGLSQISFYTMVKRPHGLSHGLTKKKQAGTGCVGEVCVEERYTPHPANPCKHVFLRGGGDTTYHLYTLLLLLHLLPLTPSHFTASAP